jgi:hypothetical protein
MVGRDSSSATKPSLATLTISMITPTMSASSDDRAIARSGSPSAARRGRVVAAIIGPSAESGPSTRMREGPNSA